MDGFNRLGWKQPQTQQVLAADTGVGPAKMGILGDAKNWEQHLEEFGFKQLKTLWSLYDLGARDVGVTRCFSYGHMTTLISRGWLNATCINHQQPSRARIFHGIQDLILTTNHFIIMSVIWIADNARNTCGFASFFILDQDGPAGQFRPPFKYI